jgi:beta-glucosidase
MNNVLRRQWGWKGWIVSDYDAYAQVFTDHKFKKSFPQAAAAALNAGLDQEGGGTTAIEQLQPAIDRKLTTASVVATAFGRLMRARIELGMFDPPSASAYGSIGIAAVRTAAATELNKVR